MTTGRINQVTDRRSLRHDCVLQAGLGTLHRAQRSRLWSADDRRDQPTEGTARQVSKSPILHRRQDTANDFSLERNTQERYARRLTCGENLPFLASDARIRPNQIVIASFSPATNPFLRLVSPSGWRCRHPYGPLRRSDLHRCDTPTVEKRGPAEGSP